MKPGLRKLHTCSLRVGYSTVVSPNLRGNLRELHHFHTEEEDRGKGYGTTLLRQVCSEADRDRIVLMLMPDDLRLMDWYIGFGFSLVQVEPPIMARGPANG